MSSISQQLPSFHSNCHRFTEVVIVSQKLSSTKVVIVSMELLLIYRTYLFTSMLIASRLAAFDWTTFGKNEIETSNDTVPNAYICHIYIYIMYNILLYYICTILYVYYIYNKLYTHDGNPGSLWRKLQTASAKPATPVSLPARVSSVRSFSSCWAISWCPQLIHSGRKKEPQLVGLSSV